MIAQAILFRSRGVSHRPRNPPRRSANQNIADSGIRRSIQAKDSPLKGCPEDQACETRERTHRRNAGSRSFWLGSKLDNVALWESGIGPILKNGGLSASSISSISRQSFERHDGISVPMVAQPVRLPQRPALALFWATELAESLISSSLARFGLQRGSRSRRSAEVAHRSKPERLSRPLSGSASAWFPWSCC